MSKPTPSHEIVYGEDNYVFVIRLEVPGGWLYNSYDKSHSVMGSAFVPFPYRRTAHEMKCVNMHDALVRALRDTYDLHFTGVGPSLKQIEELLAKAEAE